MSKVEQVWKWQTERLEGRAWPPKGWKYISAAQWIQHASVADHLALDAMIRVLDGRSDGERAV